MKVDFNPSYVAYKGTPQSAIKNATTRTLINVPTYMNLSLLKELGNNIKFGFRTLPYQTAYSKYSAPSLKQAGIKHIISIPYDCCMESMAKQDGFDSLNLAFDSVDGNCTMPWLNPPLSDKYSWEHTKPSWKAYNKEPYDKLSREFIDKFTSFIKCLQDGNCYIEGWFVPDIESVFILNKFFNPKADEITPPLHLPCILQIYQTAKMLNLYKALTKEDKAKMNWPKNFDHTFLENIKKAEYERINSEIKLHFHQIEG